MRRLLLLLIVNFLASGFAASDPWRYYPKAGWGDQKLAYANAYWGSAYLRGMGEPPLLTARDLGTWRWRFRMVASRTGGPVSAYRVDEDRHGEAELHWEQYRGTPGKPSGQLVGTFSRRLTKAEATTLEESIRSARLASLPRSNYDPHADYICTDGGGASFEWLASEGETLVVRSCGVSEKALRKLIETTLALHPSQF